ncbi:MAG: hypothetical protein ACKVOJ_02200 [Sphingomonadaceae bacterium]
MIWVSSDERRMQLWRNQAKARQLRDEHGEQAFTFVKRKLREAGFDLRARGHWRRIERHLHEISD